MKHYELQADVHQRRWYGINVPDEIDAKGQAKVLEYCVAKAREDLSDCGAATEEKLTNLEIVLKTDK